MVLRMKDFGGLLKNPTFKGVSQKANIEGRDCLKSGGLGLFAVLRWGLARKRGCYF